MDPKAIGLRIAKARKAKKLSQSALAKKVDLSRSAVAQWESGHCSPSPSALVMLSRALGVTVDALLDSRARAS